MADRAILDMFNDEPEPTIDLSGWVSYNCGGVKCSPGDETTQDYIKRMNDSAVFKYDSSGITYEAVAGYIIAHETDGYLIVMRDRGGFYEILKIRYTSEIMEPLVELLRGIGVMGKKALIRINLSDESTAMETLAIEAGYGNPGRIGDNVILTYPQSDLSGIVGVAILDMRRKVRREHVLRERNSHFTKQDGEQYMRREDIYNNKRRR